MKFFSLLLTLMLSSIAFGQAHLDLQPTQTSPGKSLPPLLPGKAGLTKHHSIVRLHLLDGRFFCSGTVVGKNYILTAGHCIADLVQSGDKIEIRTDMDKVVTKNAIAVLADGRSDQGLIKGNFDSVNPATFSQEPLAVLSSFYGPHTLIACGYPYAGKLFCSGISSREQYAFQVKGVGYLFPGMSGGPVIDTLTGTIVGVNTAAFEKGVLLSPIIEVFSHAGIKIGK